MDVSHFDTLVHAGDRQYRAGDLVAAIHTYSQAADVYRGDLCVDANVNDDAQGLIECERLRAQYLTLLARLADYHYGSRDYGASLDYAWRLLARDPCREDAHRLVMRCYVRQGERAEALRQYGTCVRFARQVRRRAGAGDGDAI